MEPKLRKIWIENAPPGASGGEFVLVDPMRLVSPLPATRMEVEVARLLDGRRDAREIRSQLADKHGGDLAPTEIKAFVTRLEEHGLLEGDKARALMRRSVEEFQDMEARPYVFQGESYPADIEELDRLLMQAEDPGRLRSAGWREAELGPVVGIVAPHVDPLLAVEAYADAYASLPEGAPLLFVLLGTDHVGGNSRFIATRKDFRTPHGLLRTDTSFIDRLAKVHGSDLARDEVLHRTEHSLEFQALYLGYRYRHARPSAVRIVPLLVGSFMDFVRAGRYPGDIPEIQAFFQALRQVAGERERAGERVIMVAGVDFSHVGLKFGDAEPPTPESLADLEKFDRSALHFAERLDGRGFYQSVARDGNAHRWCGLAPMVTLIETVRAGAGALLAYGQDYRPEHGHAVTFGALTLHRVLDE